MTLVIPDNLDYDPETGQFFWTDSKKVAGGPNNHGYIRISIKRKKYMAHHLVWYIYHKILPKQLDHINGNPADNRLLNLRYCTSHQNNQNKKYCKGVKKHSETCWEARIRINKKYVYLGTYKTEAEAKQVYLDNKLKYHEFYVAP